MRDNAINLRLAGSVYGELTALHCTVVS